MLHVILRNVLEERAELLLRPRGLDLAFHPCGELSPHGSSNAKRKYRKGRRADTDAC